MSCCVAVNRYIQSVESIRKGANGKAADMQEWLLNDTCQSQLLDPTMASDAVHFMSLQVLSRPFIVPRPYFRLFRDGVCPAQG